MRSRTSLALVLLVACALAAQAFSFEPITQEYSPNGPASSHVFRVTNTTSERIAVRISIRPRRFELDGTEIQGKESDEFIVFPRQMLLEPGERASVRVRWSGPESIDSERAYRIIAEQLPVDLGDAPPLEGGGIRLTYRYEGSLYVVPPGATADLIVDSVSPERAGGRELLRVRLTNRGTRHTLLSAIRLAIAATPNGQPAIVLGPSELPGMAGENMLAATTREFVIPVPEGLPDGPLYARIESDAQ